MISNTAITEDPLATLGTINGGAGSDTIAINTLLGKTASSAKLIVSGAFNIAYGAGDVIKITTTAAAAATTVFNGTTAGFSADHMTTAAAGLVSVYSDGTDTFFFIANTAGSGTSFAIRGKDLVTTTATNAAINAVAGNASFGFSLAADTATSYTITLT